MTTEDRDSRIRALQDAYDVEAIKLSQLPVGTYKWRLQRQRVRDLQEKLHQLRLKGWLDHEQPNAGEEARGRRPMTTTTSPQAPRVTRADKHAHIAAMDEVPGDDWRVSGAILADYAPITEERRAELMDRRTSISYRINDVEETIDAPLTRQGDRAGLSLELNMLRAWLAEIDAELEEGA